MSVRCEYCDGRFDRPALGGCHNLNHVKPRWSQRVVWLIEKELNARKQVGWSSVDREISEEIRDALATIIETAALLRSDS
jgi:hypothetical protein